jgi:hypothetical protein
MIKKTFFVLIFQYSAFQKRRKNTNIMHFIFCLLRNAFESLYWESVYTPIIILWDEVPTMVEIAIFWFQIHITNSLNFIHRKWYTGNQYMVKSAENRMCSNLELLPVINVKSRPRYISAQKISTLFWCTESEWAWNWQIIFRFASIHARACFNRWKEQPYIVLQYSVPEMDSRPVAKCD